ncbi:(2Fe-2S)-binding protein [Streptomyces sp.]|uniref:(2Fe-2S)-binding protein n=1 Tax=Streptomyces sp. TaxID=1931 RepID=UPI002F4284BD
MPVISSSYTRLTAVHPALRVTVAAPRSGGGWVAAHDLARGGAAVDAFVAWDAAQVVRDHGRPPRSDVAATLGLHRYLWPACLLFTVPWFLRRRVPRLPVTDVSFHRAAGRMTVRPASFCCLPDDPAARLPGARTVPTEAALREELRAALAEHAAPVLEAFRPLVRRGPRALWGMATDEVTEGLWYVGRLLGEEPRAVAELAALLPGDTAPYAGGAGFRPPGPPAATGCDDPSRSRLTCCLFYTVSPGGGCTGCPRALPAARIGGRASAA